MIFYHNTLRANVSKKRAKCLAVTVEKSISFIFSSCICSFLLAFALKAQVKRRTSHERNSIQLGLSPIISAPEYASSLSSDYVW